jgi:signal transduction histidine kinase
MNTRIVQDENGTHFDGTVEDITKRKQVEEARDLLVKELESKNVEMERFIYTVSHDLRSPLVTISGFTGFLKSDLLEGNLVGADADLNVINSTVAKMDLLLRDTLELSRIGRIVNPPDIVSFEDMAREARNQLVELTRANGVKVEVASDLPFVYVDHMRIVEVLVNLIENSIKYMGDQICPKIEIGYRQSDGTFFVRDNGIGIDPSQHHKVFELFYKIDGKSEGTGAGLAIVKRIIEVHGGRIWIESELGKGCMVCFTLPLSINK